MSVDSGTRGLSASDAVRLLNAHGFNEVPSAEARSLFQILLSVLREPMVALLVACASIYFVMGETHDGALLLFSVVIVMSITLFQEWKSERSVEALRDLASPRALVVRDGKEIRIAGREVVPGDLLVVSEGDRIAADATLTSSRHLKVDESLLTGESFSVAKTPALGTGHESDVPGSARLFSGTLVVAGRGLGLVTATGARTQMGQIGQSLRQAKPEDQTLLQQELARLVRLFGFVGLCFSFLIAPTYGLTRGDWPQGLLAGLAAAMSLLPEEFPVVLTVFLAMGAWRISRAQVLTRRISATEGLGSITVLCVDKTGTLTRNQMEVRALDLSGRTLTLDSEYKAAAAEPWHHLLEYGALACPQEPFDPMDRAIRQVGQQHEDWKVIREYPLSHDLLAVTFVWQAPSMDRWIVSSKGAPEAIFRLCRLSSAERQQQIDRVQMLANRGLRVLGVAKASHPIGALPASVGEFPFEFIGLVALEDPVRNEVPTALRECYEAGIRVIMMTGDYAGTAQSIAQQIGLANPNAILTGADLQGLSDLELRDRISTTNVFARMVPEQKLRVITALKVSGEIVAMTGDGVNDAPSLRWADVGIAMGGRGTDVAREAASMVLLDDHFASIVTAIALGRRIFDNIRKAIAFIIAVHVPIAGMAMLPVLLNLPLVLLPAHIVFLELVIDPACALIFEGEPAEENVMKRPPRLLGEPLFSYSEIARDFAQGCVALVFVFSAYAVTLRYLDPTLASSVAFAALVLSNLGLILVNRSRSASLGRMLRVRNPAFLWLLLGTLALFLTVIYLPAAQKSFRMAPLTWPALGLVLASGVLTVLGSKALVGGSHSLMSVTPRRREKRRDPPTPGPRQS